jgi:hypothetical protein
VLHGLMHQPASRCCGRASNRPGQRSSRHQNLGRWSTRPRGGQRPATSSTHALATHGGPPSLWLASDPHHHRRPPRARSPMVDGLVDAGCSKRVLAGRRCASRSIHLRVSIRNLVSSSHGSPPERDTHGHGRHQCSSSR